jgi:hypothetical protein
MKQVVSRQKIEEVISLVSKIQQLTGKKVVFKESKEVIKETEDKVISGQNREKLIVLLQTALTDIDMLYGALEDESSGNIAITKTLSTVKKIKKTVAMVLNASVFNGVVDMRKTQNKGLFKK